MAIYSFIYFFFTFIASSFGVYFDCKKNNKPQQQQQQEFLCQILFLSIIRITRFTYIYLLSFFVSKLTYSKH